MIYKVLMLQPWIILS